MKPDYNSANAFKSLDPAGFALTATLVMLVLVTIFIVGFVSSTSIDRATSQAYANLARAEFLAQGATDAAMARLVGEMVERPFHAIGYKEEGSPSQIVPVLYGAKMANGDTGYSNQGILPEYRYLISTLDSGTQPPSTLNDTNSVDINDNRLTSQPEGWIGSPVDTAKKAIRAPWIEIALDPTKPVQPSPAEPNFNPMVGRYAFWIVDETSKLNIARVGNTEGSGGAFKHDVGRGWPDPDNPDRPIVADLDIGAAPLDMGRPLNPSNGATNRDILDFRQNLPLLDFRFLNRVAALNPAVHETTKFYTTAFGLSNELAGTGRRRANLNALVTNTHDPEEIKKDLDDIIYVISGQKIWGRGRVFEEASVVAGMPDFGSRFYTNPVPTGDHKNIYLKKIAANIRDYIDEDSQPTYIDASGEVRAGAPITMAWRAGEEPQALGKEAIPYLQEHSWRGKEVSWSLINSSTASYEVEIDHYLEFFNPSTKDFEAPAGTYIKIYNRPEWDANSFPWVTPADFQLDIPEGTRFPAGKATVVTTDPDPLKQEDGSPYLVKEGATLVVVTPPDAARKFTGQTNRRVTDRPGLRIQARAQPTQITDYSTEFVWGSAQGVYDAHPYIAIANGSGQIFNFKGERVNTPRNYFFYASSLRGNDESSRSGDPRTLSEQLRMLPYSSTGSSDQTRFYATLQQSGPPGTSTFGKAQSGFDAAKNRFYVEPTQWADYNPNFADSSETAPAVIRDDWMLSVGELGHIYDPHRKSAGNIEHARGGGRTLPVGQAEDVKPSARFSPGWYNAAWRLCDLFSADKPEDPDLKVSNSTAPGKLNINGVLRDDGMAFKAALRNFDFLAAPDSDPNIAGNSITQAEIDALTNSVKNYLTSNGPFMSRGELSQITFFNPGNVQGGFAGRSIGTLNDRGREEVFRRVVEMITTRSASFTVYAVGEAVRQASDGTITPVAQRRIATTFHLEPELTSDDPAAEVSDYKVTRVYEQQ